MGGRHCCYVVSKAGGAVLVLLQALTAPTLDRLQAAVARVPEQRLCRQPESAVRAEPTGMPAQVCVGRSRCPAGLLAPPHCCGSVVVNGL